MAGEMLTLPVLSPRREQVGDVQVPAALVGGPVREHLLYEVVRAQLASARAGTAATKTRGFVSGGGKKPWRQKGTGRARAGSTRSPLWAGGGTIFGPQPRDYAQRLPRSARRAALRSAIAARHAEGKLLIVDAIALEEPKTKRLVEFLRGLGVDGSALLVLADGDVTVGRAARNLPHVKAMTVAGLNVYDILGHATLVVTRAAVDGVVGRVEGVA